LRGQQDRLARLADARAMLLAGAAKNVTHAIMANGFTEISRFTKEYHALFGELPRDTLKRGRALKETEDDP
jgi:AraC-like DNA-binding protein